MKTETILFSIHGDERNVNGLCGHFTSQFETRQICSYTIKDGLATITAITPLIKTKLNLPLPLQVSVTDLGSGRITGLTIDADTLLALPTVCPRPDWVKRRMMQPSPTTQQTLMADYIGLL